MEAIFWVVATAGVGAAVILLSRVPYWYCRRVPRRPQQLRRLCRLLCAPLALGLVPLLLAIAAAACRDFDWAYGGLPMFSALSELLYLAAKASLVGVYVWWVCCAAIGVGAPNRLTPGNTVEVGGAILIMGLLMLALCAAAVLAAMVVTGLVAIVLAP